jgi:internalin A
MALLISIGCKIQITVPEGGAVTSVSGNYGCSENDVCTIEVTDTSFSEVFRAVPNETWVVVGWKKGPYYFCGNRIDYCQLSTRGFGSNDGLMEMLESDTVWYLEPKFEKGIPIYDAISKIQDQALRQCLEQEQSVDYAQQVSSIKCNYRTYGKIQSLEGLQYFPLLEYIELTNHDIVDLRPIASLVHLKGLDLLNNGVVDLKAIENLTKLGGLRLDGNNVRHIPPLGKHIKLVSISLSDNQITDVTPLANTRPGSLFLHSNQIKDVRPLASLKPSNKDSGLQLGLAGNGLTDLTGLSEIKHLSRSYSSLQLQGNGITSKHLEKLSGLKVETLYLFHNKIDNLTPLRPVKILRHLDISHNKLTSLSGLSGKSLVSLEASDNSIWDISELANMTGKPGAIQTFITYLYLGNNRISNLSPLKNHYPHDLPYVPEWSPSNRWPWVSLYLEGNNISEVRDYLDGIHKGRVDLTVNPLLCSEKNSLENKTGEYNNYKVEYRLPANCVAD